MATLKVRFKGIARVQIQQAALHYATQSESNLPKRFFAAVERVLEQIPSFPESGVLFHRGVRRVNIPKFPYSIYYRVESHVLFIAVLHGKRRPSALRKLVR